MARDLLDRMQGIVSKILTNDDLLSGASITDAGFQKLAGQLGISAEETRMLFNSLISRLRKEQDRIVEAKRMFEDERFTVEPDALGNATVRDVQSGKSVFLRGKDAADAVRAAKGGVNAQAMLARFEPLMEDDTEHQDALDRTGFWGEQGAGCIVLARDTGRILLGLRSREVEQPFTWNGFGGAIDKGEKPVIAVRREVQEELGYHGEADLVPLYVFESGTFRYSNFLAIVDREFQPRLNWEHDRAEWCEWGDWPTPLHFGFKAILRDPESVQTIEMAIAGLGGAQLHENAEILTEDSFDGEIASAAGTYNFPWSIDGRHGLGTARFFGRGPSMKIKVLSVRDDQGERMSDLDDAFMSFIEQQAMDTIGEE